MSSFDLVEVIGEQNVGPQCIGALNGKFDDVLVKLFTLSFSILF